MSTLNNVRSVVMRLNERGSSLIQVLLVILVFTVLGLALIANVLGENKRTFKTESNVQARYLAESGLTYFEKDFKRFIQINTELSTISLHNFSNHLMTNFLPKYSSNMGYTVGTAWSESNPEEISIKATMVDDDTIKVISRGKDSETEEIIIGNYQIDFDADIEDPSPNFNGLAIDFTRKDVLGLELLSLLGLDLVDPTGNDKTFYRVPDDQGIGASVLFNLIGANLLSGAPFKTMEENEVVATRQGEVLGLDLLKGKSATLFSRNILEFEDEFDTNVIIDGGYTTLGLLGIKFDDYRNINFKKLAVIGNVVIKQDKKGLMFDKDIDGSRSFSFQNGLHVHKSLIIGGYQGNSDLISNLNIRGNLIVLKDLYINYTNLEFGDSTADETIFVKNNAEIKNACINKSYTNLKKFRLLAEGNITIVNNTSCSEFKGLFYSKNDIVIKTNNQPMTIKGALIGNVKVDYPNKLTYIPDSRYVGFIRLKGINLIPKGRSFQH